MEPLEAPYTELSITRAIGGFRVPATYPRRKGATDDAAPSRGQNGENGCGRVEAPQTKEESMEIGQPVREILVEPVEDPVPLPDREPEYVPDESPSYEPAASTAR